VRAVPRRGGTAGRRPGAVGPRDYLIKGLILLAALLVLVTAMVVIWKKFGRARSPRSGAPHPERLV